MVQNLVVKTRPLRRLTCAELKSYLEKAANILRGNVDHSEFRGYVFALLFYKRISDVYLEEVRLKAGACHPDDPYRKVWREGLEVAMKVKGSQGRRRVAWVRVEHPFTAIGLLSAAAFNC